MQRYRKLTQLPYSAEQLFELVLDIESYPDFVPGWHSVRILERRSNALTVEQTLKTGPLRWRFVSLATFTRPTQIVIEANTTPFRHLVLDWQFNPNPEGCLVELDVACTFRSKRLERLSKAVTPLMTDGIIAAFERRASERLPVAK